MSTERSSSAIQRRERGRMKRGRPYIVIQNLDLDLDQPVRLDRSAGGQMLSRQTFPENTWAISRKQADRRRTGGPLVVCKDKVVGEHNSRLIHRQTAAE